MNQIETHVHSLVASGAAGTIAALSLSTVEDILLRGAVSVCVGVITWFITQMLSRKLKRK